jgi:Raf kinase inhibitor-like YbhB/YbcL family protein
MASRSLLLASSLAAGMLALSSPTGHAEEALKLESDAFPDGKTIPAVHTCDGDDRSPGLHWSGAPERTKALALVVDDPDAKSGNWNHWLLFNVPPATQALGEGVPTKPKLGDGSIQGTNDFGRIGYAGPCPPKGETHKYKFKLHALSAPLELEPGAKREAVMKEIKAKSIADTELEGRYGR